GACSTSCHSPPCRLSHALISELGNSLFAANLVILALLVGALASVARSYPRLPTAGRTSSTQMGYVRRQCWCCRPTARNRLGCAQWQRSAAHRHCSHVAMGAHLGWNRVRGAAVPAVRN